MILVDTNILIDFFNFPTKIVYDIFLNENIAICGAVQAELLHGAKSDTQVNEILKMFDGLQYIDIQKDDWNKVGLFLRVLRRNGLSVPLADAIIAYLALKNNCKIWTNDNHFKLIQFIMPNLKLFVA